MPKEKKQQQVQAAKDFYSEIIATLMILLCLVLLSELGAVGVLLKQVFQIGFGDFYFIIVIFLIADGIYALLKGHFFNMHSLRFHGFILFMVSLLMLNHISFISVYGVNNGSILSDSLNLYKDVIFASDHLESFGGGLIGAIMTQIFIVLFSRIGAIIFGIIFMVLSLSFITNLNFRSIIYGVSFCGKKIKGIGLKVFRYFANIHYPTKKERIDKRDLLITLNLLNEIRSNPNDVLQQKISFDTKQVIINYLYQNNAFVANEKMQCGYSYTRYLFVGNFFNLKLEHLDKILGTKVLGYQETERLILEVPNKIKKLLCLKTLLLKSHPNDLPIGLEINETLFNFLPLETEHLLISGDYNSGITSFIKSFIITLIYRLKDDFNLIICDYDDKLNEFKYFPNLFYPISKKEEKFDILIDELTYELEKRLNIIKQFNVNDYLALNEKLKEAKKDIIKPIFLVISNINNLLDKGYRIEQKLLYFLKFAHKAGIHLLMITRNHGLPESLVSNTKSKLLFKSNSIEQSFEILENKNGCFLTGNGDALMIQNPNIYHLQIPYLAKEDFERVINKFILS